MTDRVTANLPARDFAATIAFYGRLGFTVGFQNAGWLILKRGPLELEFFPHPTVDKLTSWFSACIRTDDIEGLLADFRKADLSPDPKATPRLTGIFKLPGAPRMFALVDEDGSLIRCLDNKDR